MRKILWFTLGFGVACAIGTYFAPGNWLFLMAAVMLLAYGAFSLVRHRHIAFAAAALAGIGLTVGCCWFFVYDGIYLQFARQTDGSTQYVRLEVTDYPTQTKYGFSVDGYLTLEKRKYGCRLYLTDPEILPQPGDAVEVEAKLRLTTDGGEHEPTWHRSDGIFLLAYGEDTAAVIPGKNSLATFPARLRRAISLLLEELYPEDVEGFGKALLLGDKSGLSYTQRNTLSLVGISHVVAVSGLHLSILFGMVKVFTGRKRFLSAVVGVPVIVIFTAVAGFTPSVVRAAAMLIVSLIAPLVNREYDGPTALSIGVLVLLAANPTVSAGIGFQLSVGAVAGIQCFEKSLEAWMKEKLPRGSFWKRAGGTVASSLAVTLSSTVFTFPVVAANFGLVSLVAPVSNLLLLWVVNCVFYGIVASCVIGAAWMPLAKLLAWLVGWLIRFVLWVSALLGNIPWAAVYTQDNPYIGVLLVCVVFLLSLFILFKYQGKRVVASGLTLLLLLAMLIPRLETCLETYRVTVLDVGQGQCIVLQSRGRTFLVDCGGSEGEGAGETAARYLLTQGISRIDGLILTHYDDDHVSGVPHFLSRISTDALYLPLVEDEPLCREIGSLGKSVFYVTRDLHITWEDVTLEIFAPVSEGKSNESGLSVLFTVGKYDTLITGDMGISGEWQLLKRHSFPDIELLIAGHHGSKHSTGDTLLEMVKPEQIAISVGEDNTYGHPAQEVLLRAASYGCEIYRTDLAGTLIFRG